MSRRDWWKEWQPDRWVRRKVAEDILCGMEVAPEPGREPEDPPDQPTLDTVQLTHGEHPPPQQDYENEHWILPPHRVVPLKKAAYTLAEAELRFEELKETNNWKQVGRVFETAAYWCFRIEVK